MKTTKAQRPQRKRGSRSLEARFLCGLCAFVSLWFSNLCHSIYEQLYSEATLIRRRRGGSLEEPPRRSLEKRANGTPPKLGGGRVMYALALVRNRFICCLLDVAY